MLWKLNFIEFWVLNSITEFERKIEIKNKFAEAKTLIKNKFVEAKTLDGEEQHLTLEVSTSRTAHAEREGENTPTK
jgi:hypothetical protein